MRHTHMTRGMGWAGLVCFVTLLAPTLAQPEPIAVP
jgi:hypothetical protein